MRKSTERVSPKQDLLLFWKEINMFSCTGLYHEIQ